MVLVNGFEAEIEIDGVACPISTQRYAPDVTHPRGIDHLAAFDHEPWPRWTFDLPGGARLLQECLVDPVDGSVVLAGGSTAPTASARLSVRPLLSGRDYHALMRENPAFNFDARSVAGNTTWRPYAGLPAVAALSNGVYAHRPDWYRNFFYSDDAARGLDACEDLASPGRFDFDLLRDEALLVLRVGDGIAVDAHALAHRVRGIEGPRRAALRPLQRAADAYLVRRAPGHTRDRRLPVVHRLGPRHLHRAARAGPRQRPPRHRRIGPRRLGRQRQRRHAAEPLSRPRRAPRVQRGRCVACGS